jgi:hypothetical protein
MRKAAKITLGIVGTILLGALGSGFWDLCLHDFFTWIGHGILSLITFGFTSVRDRLYVEIAKGRNDRVGIYLLSYAFIFFGVMMGVYMRSGAFGRKVYTEMTPQDYRSIRRILSFPLLLFISVLAFRSISVTYSTGAIDHFEQAYAICLPFLPPHDRDQIRSQFAQIRSKTDYVKLLDHLNEVARANSVQIPIFSIW